MGFDRMAAMRLIDKEVLKVLQDHADERGIARISLEDIAAEIPCSPDTVKRATKRLTQEHIEKRGGRRYLHYVVKKEARNAHS